MTALTCISGGSHFGESLTRTGHCGLARAVKSMGLKTEDAVNVDFVVCTRLIPIRSENANRQTSSIGSLTDEFMRSMYLSAQGTESLL